MLVVVVGAHEPAWRGALRERVVLVAVVMVAETRRQRERTVLVGVAVAVVLAARYSLALRVDRAP